MPMTRRSTRPIGACANSTTRKKLNGAAADLVQLAQQRLAIIDEAYATLSDAQRRAQYDVQRQAAFQDAPDYRPLPPAQHTERPRDFNARPTLSQPAPSAQIAGLAAAVIAVLAVALVSIIGGLILTGGGGVPRAVPTPTLSPMDALETMITRARQLAEQNENDAQAWLDYANLLYDSVQIVREQRPTACCTSNACRAGLKRQKPTSASWRSIWRMRRARRPRRFPLLLWRWRGGSDVRCGRVEGPRSGNDSTPRRYAPAAQSRFVPGIDPTTAHR